MDIRIQMPPSKEGALLLNSNVLINDFYLLYKKDADEKGYFFAGYYNPMETYNENYIAVPFTSTFGGTRHLEAGQVFSNVRESSDDYFRYRDKHVAWKDMAKELKISWECLAETNHFYDTDTQELYIPKPEEVKFKCSHLDDWGNIIECKVAGGHVILEYCPRKMDRHSDEVLIIPICSQHNSVHLAHGEPRSDRTPGHGNGFFMKLRVGTDAIKLKNYLCLSQIKEK